MTPRHSAAGQACSVTSHANVSSLWLIVIGHRSPLKSLSSQSRHLARLIRDPSTPHKRASSVGTMSAKPRTPGAFQPLQASWTARSNPVMPHAIEICSNEGLLRVAIGAKVAVYSARHQEMHSETLAGVGSQPTAR